MKITRLAVLPVLICSLFFCGTAFSDTSGDGKAPKAFFPESTYTFETVLDGAEVTHDFIIRNKGEEPLEVQNVATG